MRKNPHLSLRNQIKIGMDCRKAACGPDSGLKLDIGCGPRKAGDDFVGIDILPFPGVDVRLDLEQNPLPYPNNSVAFVRASHVMEHIQNLVPLLNEIWRVLKDGAVLEITVPNNPALNCWTDPGHRRRFSIYSFDLYDPDHHFFRESGWSTALARFKVLKKCENERELFFRLAARKKKVCLVAPPSSIHTRRWRDHLLHRGFEVCVAARIKKGVSDVGLGVEAVDRDESYRSMPDAAKQLFEQKCFDVVHLHYPSRYGSILKAVPANARRVLSVWGEDVLIEAKECPQAARRLRDALEAADFVTTTSQHMANILMRQFDIPRRSLWVIPWGYDDAVFNNDSQDDDLYLNRHCVPSSGPIFLSARVCRPQNNIRKVIEGFLESGVPGSILVLSGDLKDPPYYRELQKHFNNSRVHFLPTLSVRELSAVYRASTATVTFPYVDQLSTTVLESLACGTPIICSDLPSYHERIVDDYNGWFAGGLLPSDLAEAFKQASAAMMSRGDEIRRAAKTSVALDKWAQNADFLIQLYDAPLNYDDPR